MVEVQHMATIVRPPQVFFKGQERPELPQPMATSASTASEWAVGVVQAPGL